MGFLNFNGGALLNGVEGDKFLQMYNVCADRICCFQLKEILTDICCYLCKRKFLVFLYY